MWAAKCDDDAEFVSAFSRGCQRRVACSMVSLLTCSMALGPSIEGEASDATVAKQVVRSDASGENLLEPNQWRAWGEGFEREADTFVCNNGAQARAQRGASQTVVLNQTTPEPIVAEAWSKAEGVTGGPDNDYALYLDLIYADGTPLYGQTAPFSVGTHDWQRREVVILPDKPVKQVSVHLLLRRHGGKAWFRGASLRTKRAPRGAAMFDGVPVIPSDSPTEGFQIRDVATNSDFVHLDREALGVRVDVRTAHRDGVTFVDADLTDTTGRDRAVTLVYAIPSKASHWFQDLRATLPVERNREYTNASRFRAGTGRLSRYPFGAVRMETGGLAVGIDMAVPAFYRVGYNQATGELFLAYDIGLAPERPTAHVRFCRFSFAPRGEFRAALDRYYRIFPDAFRCRITEQGLWMPFSRISQVEGWEDFGFRFKEGNNETVWDDAHGIITFRYTEPMTWWMRMPPDIPRTMEDALAYARKLADERGDVQARALLTSGYHNEQGRFAARLLDRPWCDGAVWSMNSMPRISGEVTDFRNKWNDQLRQKLYGPGRNGDLDGEYVDSSEGYVTDELDFRRDHFQAARTPLTFSPESHRPAIFRGLIAFEYVRAIADDVHSMGKYMMANSTPIRLCWLAPLLDVMGTETDWNPGGKWRPMSDAELLYRRSLCKSKPFCFLMNTRFEQFSYNHVERYMARALAYGMFPGFFSHNASQGHYFTRPELYNRDRPLFRKYVPLCKMVAEAGWEPSTLARVDDDRIRVERFGKQFLTLLNDSSETRTFSIETTLDHGETSVDLVSGEIIRWKGDRATMTLDRESVALIRLTDGG